LNEPISEVEAVPEMDVRPSQNRRAKLRRFGARVVAATSGILAERRSDKIIRPKRSADLVPGILPAEMLQADNALVYSNIATKDAQPTVAEASELSVTNDAL
jgi:hypothetical protein